MFDWLNWTVLQSALRYAAMGIGTTLFNAGVLDKSSETSFEGAVLALGAFGWALWEAHKAHAAKQVVKAVANTTTETKQAVVNAAPANTVESVLKSVFKGK